MMCMNSWAKPNMPAARIQKLNSLIFWNEPRATCQHLRCDTEFDDLTGEMFSMSELRGVARERAVMKKRNKHSSNMITGLGNARAWCDGLKTSRCSVLLPFYVL